MVHKCANPECVAPFLYLREGKLFEVETHYRDRFSGERYGRPVKGKGHVERFWLCDHCAARSALRFDRERGLVLESMLTGRKIGVTSTIVRSNGKAESEIEGVLIRPLDLNFPFGSSRKAATESNIREREIA